MPKVSIIIPARNRVTILMESLKTIARQSYPTEEREVVVVDDGSTDETVIQIHANDYPFRLVFARLDAVEKFCPARPRNQGLSLASGEIVIFLDADILCSSELISQHVAAHEQNDKPQAVIGYTYGFPADPADRTPEAMNPPPPHLLLEMLPSLITADPQHWGDSREQIYASSRDLIDHPMPWQVFWTNNVSLPRRLALDIGGFDEEFTGWGIEDIEFAYRLFQCGIVFTLSRKAWGVHYPHRDHDLSGRSLEMEINCRRLIRKHPNLKLEVSVWAWESAGPIWTALEGLRLSSVCFDSKGLETTSALLGQLKMQAFVPGPILWCGDAPEALTAALSPAVCCWPSDGIGDACYPRMPLLGVRTPWEDAAFAGVVVTDYWRCVPAVVLARMVEELIRVARTIIFLFTRSDAVAGATRLRTIEDCKAALTSLPGDYVWEERSAPGLVAFLVYPFPKGMGNGSPKVGGQPSPDSYRVYPSPSVL